MATDPKRSRGRKAVLGIRAEREGDHGRVGEIHAAAFGRPDEAELVSVLRRRARPQLSLVGEEGGVVAGHVFVSPVELDPPAGPAPLAGLAPIAVDPARQGRGIGSALVRAALEGCRAVGWRAVFLVGDPAWYARFGFAAAAPRGFTYGAPAFDAALQVLELDAGVLAGCRGRVVYHAAFGQSRGA